MRDDYRKFEGAGARIVVVGKHTPEEMKQYWEQHHLPYTGIPDPDSRVSDLYHQQWKLLRLGRMPALFIVENRGQITFAHYSSSMSDIPPNEQILEELK